MPPAEHRKAGRKSERSRQKRKTIAKVEGIVTFNPNQNFVSFAFYLES